MPPQLEVFSFHVLRDNPQRIIKGRPFEVGFERRDPELYRKEHPLWR